MPIGVATPIVEKDRVFFTSFYDGSLMLQLKQDQPAVEKVWQRNGASENDTDALQSIISTPLFEDGHVYGVDSYGELRCLRGQRRRPLVGRSNGRSEGPLEHDPLRAKRRADVDVQ